MPDWSRRMAMVAVGSCATMAIAGCADVGDGDGDSDGDEGADGDGSESSDGSGDGAVLTQPEYDCSRVSRPDPDAPETPDAVGPVPYPDPPDDAGAGAALTEYVENFERAYRQNRLVASEGSALVRFGFSPREMWIVDSSSSAGVGGVQYTYWYEIEEGGITHFDSPNEVAVYYVDGSVALRAHEEGRREDGVEPAPLETGAEVACFE
jgi:hypothetical protein